MRPGTYVGCHERALQGITGTLRQQGRVNYAAIVASRNALPADVVSTNEFEHADRG